MLANLTQAQKNKLLAAAEIVEGGDMAVLQKILEFGDILEKYKEEIGQLSEEARQTVTKLENTIEELASSTIARIEETSTESKIASNEQENKVLKAISDAQALVSEIQTLSKQLVAFVEAKINGMHTPTMPVKGVDYFDGKDADPKEVAEMVVKMLPESEPLTGDTLIETINDEETEKKIKKERIEGWDELVKKVGRSGGNNFVVSRGVVKAYDLSSSLNGVLKTFSLPAFWRVISVHLSSFPNIVRETIDYTTDASAMTITFTSQIDAGSTLATGQTLLVVYAES